MKTTPKAILVLSTIVAVLLLLLPTRGNAGGAQQTLKNLNNAYRGESNASNEYAKFAEKASSEGYPQVAKLFRAASASEATHSKTHKAAILKLGGKVEAFQLDPVTPGSTADNLKASIKDEIHESTKMYPGFIATAKADEAPAAIRSFTFAMEAEKEHAKLFQEALHTLGKNAPADYYVCQVCGMTLKEVPAKKCPSCHGSRDEYKKIN
jgi:rubrerythrin